MKRTYTVAGNWPFPLDMLRHDEAEPANETASAMIVRMSGGQSDPEIGSKMVEIDLQMEAGDPTTGRPFGRLFPNENRWLSFGWRVVEAGHDFDEERAAARTLLAEDPRSSEISLTTHEGEEGWGHGVWFGTNSDSGWVLECDMEKGKLISAFTPAGTDPLFLMQVEGEMEGHTQLSRITITVERDDVEWNPITRTLTIRDDR